MFSFKKNNKINGTAIGLLAFLLLGGNAFAAVPNWSVNSGSYQYSMSFISALNIQGTESVNGSDMVGAFVKGQCRGIAKPTVVQPSGRHLAYLLVYSNLTQGDTIVFKVYDSTRDSVFTVPNKIAFQSDVSKGIASDPYVIYTDNLPSDLSISNAAVEENKIVGSTVGTFKTVDSDQNSGFVYTLVPGVGDTNNTSFKISGDQLLTNGVFDYQKKATYSIRVKTTDPGGASLSMQFTIKIIQVNQSPAIAKQSFTLKENSPANTSVGTIVATNKYGGPLTFKLGKANHDSTFTIIPTTGEIKVQSPSKLDYETTRVFSFYVLVSNNGNPPLADSGLVVISLLNVNEAPVIKTQDFSVNENAPANTFVGKLQASDVDSGHVLKFHLAGISPDFGSASKAFTINENTGEITVISAVHLDFETTPVFTLKVIVEDEFHLKDSTAVTVHLINQIENTVSAFNLFSPNGDGSNDFWEIQNVDLYKGFTVTIFDSAGEIVFEKTDYKNDWDGTYKGKAVPEGMYYYSLKSPDYKQDYKGAITIIR
jgi:gliding motility-associated-like protein